LKNDKTLPFKTKIKTKTFSQDQDQDFSGQDQDKTFKILSLRSLETKTLVSRTTSPLRRRETKHLFIYLFILKKDSRLP
jgi:hypothetical protein